MKTADLQMRNHLIDTTPKWLSFNGKAIFEPDNDYIFKVQADLYYSAVANSYQNYLSDEEVNKAFCFKQQADQQRFIATRVLIRLLLSKFIPYSPEEITFKYSTTKKPSVEGIEFNISHSGNFILIAISANEIGIDIEHIKSKFDFEPMLTESFSPHEIAFIKNAADQSVAFYTLWTRKEALLKGSGEGLTDSLAQVPSLAPLVHRRDSDYLINSFKVEEDYVASIASVNTRHQPIYLNLVSF